MCLIGNKYYRIFLLCTHDVDTLSHCRFGQLGCSGFIVSDRDGCFVSRKTKAYLQYGDAAFSHVEELLLKNFGIQPSQVLSNKNVHEEDVLNPNWVLPSVGVPSMDQEH